MNSIQWYDDIIEFYMVYFYQKSFQSNPIYLYPRSAKRRFLVPKIDFFNVGKKRGKWCFLVRIGEFDITGVNGRVHFSTIEGSNIAIHHQTKNGHSGQHAEVRSEVKNEVRLGRLVAIESLI